MPPHVMQGHPGTFREFFEVLEVLPQRVHRGSEWIVRDKHTFKVWVVDIYDNLKEIDRGILNIFYSLPYVERPSFYGVFLLMTPCMVLFFERTYHDTRVANDTFDRNLNEHIEVSPARLAMIIKTLMTAYDNLKANGLVYTWLVPSNLLVTDSGACLEWSRNISPAGHVMLISLDMVYLEYQGYMLTQLAHFNQAEIARTFAHDYEALMTCLVAKFSRFEFKWTKQDFGSEETRNDFYRMSNQQLHEYLAEHIQLIITHDPCSLVWRLFFNWLFRHTAEIGSYVDMLGNLIDTTALLDVHANNATELTLSGHRDDSIVFVEFYTEDKAKVSAHYKYIMKQPGLRQHFLMRSFFGEMFTSYDMGKSYVAYDLLLYSGDYVSVLDFIPHITDMSVFNKVANSLFRALSQLHSAKVVLRNLRLDNVFVSRLDYTVRFTQFGYMLRSPESTLDAPLSVTTAPSEDLDRTFATAMADDVWSAAVILVYMMSRTPGLPPTEYPIFVEGFKRPEVERAQSQVQSFLASITEPLYKRVFEQALNLTPRKRASSLVIHKLIAAQFRIETHAYTPAQPTEYVPRTFIKFYAHAMSPYNLLDNFSKAHIMLDAQTLTSIHDVIPGFLGKIGDTFESSEHLWRATQAVDEQSYQRLTSLGTLGTLSTQAMKLFYGDDKAASKYDHWIKKNNVGIVAKLAAEFPKRVGMNMNSKLEKLPPLSERALWMAILRAKFTQNEEHKQALLGTGDAILYMFDFGAASAQRRAHWGAVEENGILTGDNAMGKYVQAVRDTLR